MPAPTNPRLVRLQNEWRKLQQLNADSDTVKVEPLAVSPGCPPEQYRVTFLCRSISGIDRGQNPVYADQHRVLIVCHESFPREPPVLRWETPLWHPNIQHDGFRSVCINKSEWLGGNGLEDLCRMLFEMVQYKNYHAISGMRPYPLDGAVARWVREVGEPRGIVNKETGHFTDNKPFTRPKKVPIRVVGKTGRTDDN